MAIEKVCCLSGNRRKGKETGRIPKFIYDGIQTIGDIGKLREGLEGAKVIDSG